MPPPSSVPAALAAAPGSHRAARPSEQGPPRKFYALNAAGRQELARFWAKWEYVTERIEKKKYNPFLKRHTLHKEIK